MWRLVISLYVCQFAAAHRLLSRYLTDTPEVLVLAAQQVHERIGIFRRDILVSMQMESNGLQRGLMGAMYNRRPRWLHAGLRALGREAHLCGSHPIGEE